MDSETFAQIFKGDYGARFLKEAQPYSEDVIDCVRNVCAYIYRTHSRFPAHGDAIYAPGSGFSASSRNRVLRPLVQALID